MQEIIIAQPLPSPRCPGAISVRPATAADLPFVDQLQKMHSHMVGFIPIKQFEKHVDDGNLLIAEEAGMGAPTNTPSAPRSTASVPVGYVLAKDQYLKRDDVGIVYQLNVMPLRQRGLIGAHLIKSVFERAAYGCRLFSCWCAQDIQANWFWESIGFVPLAFRTGSRSKQRIHIFWQKRIREGDEGAGATPYWFPSQTSGGAVMEDRIVLPIPPGTHWRDAKPLVLPGVQAQQAAPALPTCLPGGAPVKSRPAPQQSKLSKAERAVLMRSQSQHLGGVPLGKKAIMRGGRITYVDRTDFVAELDMPEDVAPKARSKKPRAPRLKNDTVLVKHARELRDRFLDEVNSGRLLPGGGPTWQGEKYAVTRLLPTAPMDAVVSDAPRRLLDAA